MNGDFSGRMNHKQSTHTSIPHNKLWHDITITTICHKGEMEANALNVVIKKQQTTTKRYKKCHEMNGSELFQPSGYPHFINHCLGMMSSDVHYTDAIRRLLVRLY